MHHNFKKYVALVALIFTVGSCCDLAAMWWRGPEKTISAIQNDFFMYDLPEGFKLITRADLRALMFLRTVEREDGVQAQLRDGGQPIGGCENFELVATACDDLHSLYKNSGLTRRLSFDPIKIKARLLEFCEEGQVPLIAVRRALRSPLLKVVYSLLRHFTVERTSLEKFGRLRADERREVDSIRYYDAFIDRRMFRMQKKVMRRMLIDDDLRIRILSDSPPKSLSEPDSLQPITNEMIQLLKYVNVLWTCLKFMPSTNWSDDDFVSCALDRFPVEVDFQENITNPWEKQLCQTMPFLLFYVYAKLWDTLYQTAVKSRVLPIEAYEKIEKAQNCLFVRSSLKLNYEKIFERISKTFDYIYFPVVSGWADGLRVSATDSESDEDGAADDAVVADVVAGE